MLLGRVSTVPHVTAPADEAHLEPGLVGDISGGFFVPAYQRGYRWGEVEVRRLLDDIWESRDGPYYLQPVAVKPHDDQWELVDGQQPAHHSVPNPPVHERRRATELWRRILDAVRDKARQRRVPDEP